MIHVLRVKRIYYKYKDLPQLLSHIAGHSSEGAQLYHPFVVLPKSINKRKVPFRDEVSFVGQQVLTFVTEQRD